MKHKSILFFLLTFVWTFGAVLPSVYAEELPQVASVQSLKGLAVVRIKSRRVPDLILQQAVLITPDGAQFIGITDFGNVAFKVGFAGDKLTLGLPGQQDVETSSKKLKRLLSMPVSKDEFLAIIRHELPAHFKTFVDAEGEIWSNPKKKKLKIRFSDFQTLANDVSYPHRIVMEHKDNVFDLKWQNVSLQSAY